MNAISTTCAAIALGVASFSVPEPGTMLLLGAGLIVLAFGLRRFRHHRN